jgi:hypothetical protein
MAHVLVVLLSFQKPVWRRRRRAAGPGHCVGSSHAEDSWWTLILRGRPCSTVVHCMSKQSTQSGSCCVGCRQLAITNPGRQAGRHLLIDCHGSVALRAVRCRRLLLAAVYPLGGSTQLLLCRRSDRELIVDSAACRGAADGQVWMQAWSGSCMPCKSKHRSCILLATCGA